MRTVIISDLHLGHPHARVGPLLSLLTTANYDRLVLNGDVTDHLNFHNFPATHLILIDVLRDIARKRSLLLILGNHDAPTLAHSHLVPRLLGVTGHRRCSLDAGADEWILEHGDAFDRFRDTYIAAWAGYAHNLAYPVSRTFAKWLEHRVKEWVGHVKTAKALAIARAHNGGYAGVIIGHLHVADDDATKKERYINTGSWLDNKNFFAEIDHGKVALVEWHPA